MTTAQPIQIHAPDAPEDRARADLYALIATLFYAPPDAGLLQALAEADEIVGEDDSVALAEAWGALQRAVGVAEKAGYAVRVKHFFSNKNEVTRMMRALDASH